MDFDTAERLAIVEEWKRQQAAWKPKQGYATGCLMMLAAAALYPTLPGVIKFISPALLVLGFVVMQSRQLPGDPREIADKAATLLASGGGEPAARRTAAVSLLFHAWDQRGPTMSAGYDHAAIRDKLGAGLGHLQSVEQVLKDELKLAPVFTT